MNLERRAVAGCLQLILSLLVAGCGSSGGTNPPGNSSGLPRASTLATLTTAQTANLCDWVNAKEGGYGRSATCSDGSKQMSDLDQTSCADSVVYLGTSCPTLAVGDVEDCANATGTNLCGIPTAPACAAFDACVGS